MNKERLEWVMSGLSQYKLTKDEDQFTKSASGDFDQNQMLTDRQEKRLENFLRRSQNRNPIENLLIILLFRKLPQKRIGSGNFLQKMF